VQAAAAQALPPSPKPHQPKTKAAHGRAAKN